MMQRSRVSDVRHALDATSHNTTAVEKPKQARVLVIEEIAALREHMINILRSSMHLVSDISTVGITNSVSVREALSYNPDMIVMDLTCNFSNSSRLAEDVWHEHTKIKFLFWCGSSRQISVPRLERLLPAQAVYGCIMKSASDEQLAFAIHRVLVHGNTYVDPKLREADYKQRQQCRELSDAELRTLKDIAIGLTDCAMAERHNISARGIQSRISSLFAKVLSNDKYDPNRQDKKDRFNPRTRLIFEAINKGLIDAATLADWSRDYIGDLGSSSDFSP